MSPGAGSGHARCHQMLISVLRNITSGTPYQSASLVLFIPQCVRNTEA